MRSGGSKAAEDDAERVVLGRAQEVDSRVVRVVGRGQAHGAASARGMAFTVVVWSSSCALRDSMNA